MRDFSWKYFAMTGDVDAYMLFKETCMQDMGTQESAEVNHTPLEEEEE